jgi:glycerol uptake facilitator-like aquaporin
MELPRRLLAEFLGTALLLATVVGSGIMATTLSPGNAGVSLLANAAATAGVLFVLITTLAPVSGAHFNPAVTMAMWLRRELSLRDAVAYVGVQVVAAFAGVVLAHAMFAQELLQPGTHARTGAAQWLSETVATFGLVLVILLAQRRPLAQIAALVASWIFAAYWFTASTSFANPAVTLARSLTRSFAGIRPDDVAWFVVAQLAGTLVALAVARVLRDRGPEAEAA